MEPISPRDIQTACHQAVQQRRQAAIDAGAPEGNLGERIIALPFARVYPTRQPNWFRVGTVYDDVIEEEWSVYWNSQTGDVQLEPSSTIDHYPVRQPKTPALLYSIYGPKHYIADPNFRFFLGGQEYSPEEAEIIASERKSTAGWTWRPR
jgi:hypothetical protein